MALIKDILQATWLVYVVASPYILLGLIAAGLLNVLIPARRVARWLGRPGFGATARAACLGIPLPLCSCAVVPVTIELSRKGASREASLAFLVSTPETGVDSILLTYGLMGPVMAVMRPLAALATSLVAAASSMVFSRSDAAASGQPPGGNDDPSNSSPAAAVSAPTRGWPVRAARHAFIGMVDEIGFWLVTGFLLTGLITALVPDDLIRTSLGTGPLALIALLLLGVPLYMCASASTPIAAALLLKGISPGAALVFLLAGPATNASSLVVITRFFGRRFVGIYLGSVVVTALAMGLLLDWLAQSLRWSIEPSIMAVGAEEGGWIYLGSAAVLTALLLASLLRGAWQRSFSEAIADFRQWRGVLRS
jgi:uncharacterized membrane protein YraQ (UPF0718 family)